jgi:hypothetical protein
MPYLNGIRLRVGFRANNLHDAKYLTSRAEM